MKYTIGCLLAVIFLTVSIRAGATTHVTITVIDADGNPVTGANVQGREGPVDEATTDASGTAELIQPSFSDTPILIEKEGYYITSTWRHDLVPLGGGRDHVERTFRLMEKRNPIPLYAKRFRGEVPKADQKIGFDFSEGDWLAPHGDGEIAHIYFRVSGWVEPVDDRNSFDMRLDISFPNYGDGIQTVLYEKGKNSKLRFPYKAPKNGYKPRMTLRAHRIYQVSDGEVDVASRVDDRKRKNYYGYLLRVNTMVDEEGRIQSANYVKIRRRIDFSINAPRDNEDRIQRRRRAESGSIDMRYYYNPRPNNRNLEFDTEHNLFDNEAMTRGLALP